MRMQILLATRNGAAHLDAQLESYLAQDHADWDLWVSDDGSQDDTVAILQAFRAKHGAGRDIRILSGPRKGSAANFLSLLSHPDLPSGPVALSDQDDVWLPHKLRRAVVALERARAVAIYGGQSLHVDAALQVMGRSKLGQARPAFGNALTQNIVSGHSTVLSAGALELVRAAGPQPVPHHDWWLYQLVSAAGGEVLIDPEPVLKYRQHGTNAMGAHQGVQALWARAAQVLGRDYGNWIEVNLAALHAAQDLLTAQNRAVLHALQSCPRPAPDAAQRHRAALRRAMCMARQGLHRQGRVQTLLFYLAVLLGRA